MSALDFPDSPTNGQVYDKWTWNGTMWALTPGTGGGGGGGSGFTYNQDATPTASKAGDTWYHTATGDSFVWTTDGTSNQWVQFAPGSGGGGGSGFTYVTDVAPVPSKVGDTWFDISTLASGGTSWVAIEESPGGEKVWVQFAPGTAPIAATWQSYTPAVTATGANPVLTGAAFTGTWLEEAGGLIHWAATIAAAASGTTAGSGTYSLSLPKPGTTVGGFQILGTGWIYGITGFKLITLDLSGPQGSRMLMAANGNPLGATDGFSNGSVLCVSGSYKAA